MSTCSWRRFGPLTPPQAGFHLTHGQKRRPLSTCRTGLSADQHQQKSVDQCADGESQGIAGAVYQRKSSGTDSRRPRAARFISQELRSSDRHVPRGTRPETRSETCNIGSRNNPSRSGVDSFQLGPGPFCLLAIGDGLNFRSCQSAQKPLARSCLPGR